MHQVASQAQQETKLAISPTIMVIMPIHHQGGTEPFFLDDEAGANESTGNDSQDKPLQITREHLCCVFRR